MSVDSDSASLNVRSGLVRYITNLFNPKVQLCAVSRSTSGGTGVTFNWMSGKTGFNLPGWDTYIGFENWKYAVGLWGINRSDPTSKAILTKLESLKTEVGWVAPWNDECFLGTIVPYARNDYNIIFTKDQTGGTDASLPKDSAGKPYLLVQAAPWAPQSSSWKSPGGTQAGSLNFTWAQEQADQAMNWYLRGNNANALTCFQQFASQASRLADGAIAFGPSIHSVALNGPAYRGIYLGMFLQLSTLLGLGSITMPDSITRAEVLATANGLQCADGGIAWNYSSMSKFTGSIDEATNALLLAFSPGAIEYCQDVATSGKYNANSDPPLVPNLTLS
jgi:hypothetical protein